jgi:NitT/TauT family transport system substrate-binding protein
MKRLKPGVSVLAVVVGLSMALSACSSGKSSGGDNSNDAVVRIATGVDASYAPVYVAAERGLFKKHGVKVEYITTEGGPAAGQAVIAGTADIATLSDGTSVTLMGQDEKLNAFAVLEESSRYIKIVMRKGISSPDQIKNIASIPGIIQMATTRYLEHAGIDPKSVKFITATPPDVPTLMQRKDIDASIISEPWASRTAAAGGEITGDIGDFGMKYAQWLLADASWLKNNASAAAKVRAALAEANELVSSDPQAVAKITEEAVQVPKDLTISLLPEITFKLRDLTDDDVARAKATAEFFVGAGAMKAVPALKDRVLTAWSESNKP